MGGYRTSLEWKWAPRTGRTPQFRSWGVRLEWDAFDRGVQFSWGSTKWFLGWVSWELLP
jgi:hypothetical protein